MHVFCCHACTSGVSLRLLVRRARKRIIAEGIHVKEGKEMLVVMQWRMSGGIVGNFDS